MQDYLPIQEAADHIHVNPTTLRRWEKAGEIKPFYTAGGQRRYTVDMLDEVLKNKNNTVSNDLKKSPKKRAIGYCRVSSIEQKADLTKQADILQIYCKKKNIPFEIIKDTSSENNFKRKGLKKIIHLICTEQIDTIVINSKENLMNFGYDLFEAFCKEHDVKIIIIDRIDDTNNRLDLTRGKNNE